MLSNKFTRTVYHYAPRRDAALYGPEHRTTTYYTSYYSRYPAGPRPRLPGPARFLTCPQGSRVALPSPLKSPGSVRALLHRRPLKRVSCAIASRLAFPLLFEPYCVMYSAIHNRHDHRWFCECSTTDFHEEVTVTANWSKPSQPLWSRIRGRGGRPSSRLPRFGLTVSLFSLPPLFYLLFSTAYHRRYQRVSIKIAVRYRAIMYIPL